MNGSEAESRTDVGEELAAALRDRASTHIESAVRYDRFARRLRTDGDLDPDGHLSTYSPYAQLRKKSLWNRQRARDLLLKADGRRSLEGPFCVGCGWPKDAFAGFYALDRKRLGGPVTAFICHDCDDELDVDRHSLTADGDQTLSAFTGGETA